MENKNNISKEDFLKLFDSDEPAKLDGLDDFEKEAAEGLKLMKNPSLVNSIDEKIDEKLTELISEGKKGRSKGGMYFLAIAASIVLVIGLFFIFKQTENDLIKNVAVVDETKPAKDEQPIEDALNKSDSDEKINSEAKEKNAEQIDNSGGNYKESLKNEFSSNGTSIPATTLDAIPKEPDLSAKAKGTDGFLGPTDNENKKITTITTSKEGVNSKKDANNDYAMTFDEVALEEDNAVKVSGNTKTVVNNGEVKGNVDDAGVKDKRDAETKAKVSPDRYAKVLAEQTAKRKAEEEAAKKSAEVVTAKKKTKFDEDITVNARSETSIINENSSNMNTGSGATTVPSTSAGVINNTSNVPSSALTVTNTTGSGGGTNYVVSEFVGGKQALDNYIKANLKIPESCLSEEVIVIRFDVSANGEISKSKILSKTGNCKDCEKEAHAFVKKMPNWKPATSSGKAIASTQQITLSFKK